MLRQVETHCRSARSDFFTGSKAGDPVISGAAEYWIPAFAGTTPKIVRVIQSDRNPPKETRQPGWSEAVGKKSVCVMA